MRRLRRSVERTRRGKKVASQVAIAMLSASLAVSETAMTIHAEEPTGVVSEYEEDTTGEDTEEEDGEEPSEDDDESVEDESEEEETEEDETEEDETEEDETEAGEPEGGELPDGELVDGELLEGELTEEELLLLQGELLPNMMLLGAAPEPEFINKTVEPEAGDTIDLDEVEIENGTITVDITESGSYTLTGSNERNGAYVDVQIKVASGAKVKLYFDDFDIVNDDSVDDSKATTSYFSADCISPIVINGTADVYIKDDSTIEAISDFFTVNGKLNFVESEGGAELEVSLSKKLGKFMQPMAFAGSGEVHYQGACVTVKNETSSGASYSWLEKENEVKICIEGGNVALEGVKSDTIQVGLYRLSGVNLGNYRVLVDSDGNEVEKQDLFGFPANGKIVQINNKPVEGFSFDSEGKLSDMVIPDPSYFYVEVDGVVKGYYGWAGESPTEVAQYLVIFKDSVTGAEIKKYYSQNGEVITLPEEDDAYTYSYELEDGTPVTVETKIYGDMVVMVTKVEKGKVTITIDGVTRIVDYGATFKSLGLSGDIYVDVNTGKVVSLDETIVEPRSFEKIPLTHVNKNGAEWFVLNTADELDTFAEFVNRGATDINGYLASDITVGNDFDMIGSIEIEGGYFGSVKSENAFCGFFDGKGHTVTLNLSHSDQSHVGLFGCVTAGATISDITTAGSVTGGTNCGGLVGSAFCKSGGGVRIEKCFNHASVNGSDYIGGLVGALETTNFGNISMPLQIQYCGNTGNVTADGNAGGILGYRLGGNEEIVQCFNAAECELTKANGITASCCYSRIGNAEKQVEEASAEAFASGEVAYLMNRAAGAEKWFQTCGSGVPALSGQHVYRGYTDCTSTVPSYANTPFTHTVPGHKNKEIYTYENGGIVAECVYCPEKFTADIEYDTEEIGSGMKGVLVKYSDAWEDADYPAIEIGYADAVDGEYVKGIPAEVGTWYLKAYISGTDEAFLLSEPYTILPKKESESNGNHHKKSSGSSGGGNSASAASSQNTATVATAPAAVPIGPDGAIGWSGISAKVDSAAVGGVFSVALNGAENVDTVVLSKMADRGVARVDFAVGNGTSISINPAIAKPANGQPFVLKLSSATMQEVATAAAMETPQAAAQATNPLSSAEATSVTPELIRSVGGNETSRVVAIRTNNIDPNNHCVLTFAKQSPYVKKLMLYRLDTITNQLILMGEYAYNAQGLTLMELACFNFDLVLIEQ